jgi:hypothetical protein
MPPARKREPVVPEKVKAAYEYMLSTPGATLQTAAAHVGWITRKLRFQMSQPHCIRWMLQEKHARLEAASAGNIAALLSVRDYGDNAMAKVHAAKTLETMLDTVSERTGINRAIQQQRQPGLQIVIVQSDGTKEVAYQPPAALIEAPLRCSMLRPRGTQLKTSESEGQPIHRLLDIDLVSRSWQSRVSGRRIA